MNTNHKVFLVSFFTLMGWREQINAKGEIEYAPEWGAPVLFWGLPGVGKTTKIRAWCKGVKAFSKIFSPGQHGEGAVGMVPVPFNNDKGEQRLGYPSPDWVDEFRDFSRGLLFLDEISNAPPMIQSPLLAIVLGKTIGQTQLDPSVRVMAAANPPECAAHGFDMSAPLSNRFLHLPWTNPTGAEVGAYLLQNGGRAQAEVIYDYEQQVLNNWDKVWPVSASAIDAFLRARPELAHKMPAEDSPDYGKGWPSPRSWDLAARILTTAKILFPKDVDLLVELITGAVGVGAGKEFVNHMISMDLPDPHALFDGSAKFPMNKDRQDRMLACLSSMVGVIVMIKNDDKKRDEYVTKMADLFYDIKKNDMVDVTIPPMGLLKEAKMIQPGNPKQVRMRDYSREIDPFLSEVLK